MPNSVTQALSESGRYLDVYLDGQFMQADSSDQVNDYEETSGGSEGVTAGTIKFHRRVVRPNARLTFVVYKTQ